MTTMRHTWSSTSAKVNSSSSSGGSSGHRVHAHQHVALLAEACHQLVMQGYDPHLHTVADLATATATKQPPE